MGKLTMYLQSVPLYLNCCIVDQNITVDMEITIQEIELRAVKSKCGYSLKVLSEVQRLRWL